MNTFNWKMVVAAVLTMFLSTACSKKLMPPEIETSNGGVESSDFTASNGTSSGGDEFGGSGGPGDSGFFSEEPIVEGSGSGNGGNAGMMADGAGSASGPDGIGGNSMGGFGSSGRADIDNGSSGAFGADNPFASNDSGTGTGGNGSDGFGSSGRADTGSNDHRLNPFHATNDLKDIHFNFDQYDLDSNSKKVLEANASFLKSNPDMRVEIQGHCDERGTNNYNIALGERRANSTKKYLVAQGVDSSRVNIISYGEEKPFCSDSNENCWFQNRRAHFMVAR
jgi:peptidoglycan-associated lipoprotein